MAELNNIPGNDDVAKIISSTNGNLYEADANGDLVDSGVDKTQIPTAEETLLYKNTASSGIIDFDGLAINGDNTKYDIGAMKGWIVDNITDPENPTSVFIEFPLTTAITSSLLATNLVTWVGIDSGLSVIEQGTPFTAAQRRSIIQLGVVVHSDNIIVNAINNLPVIASNPLQQMVDLFKEIGIFNGGGNRYSAASTDLTIKKTTGSFVNIGVNYDVDPLNPHSRSLAAVDPITFRYRLNDSTEYSNTTNIDPDNYDLAGVLTSVPNNKFTIQRINVFSSNLTRVQYGQFVYNTMAEALQALDTTERDFIVESNIDTNAINRAFLIVKKGTVNLTNAANAVFVEAARFKDAHGVGGTSSSSLQQVYNNSTTPEITTNSDLGAVTIKRGSAADTDIVFETLNGADAITFSVTGEGKVEDGEWNATELAILYGGTGETTAQAAIDALSNVAAATNEHVLTKDTGTGNAVWKASVGGATIYTKASVNLTHSSFTAAATLETINLFTLPAGAALKKIVMKTSTAFAGTGITAWTLEVGISGSTDKYATAFDVFQTIGDTVLLNASNDAMENWNATTQVTITARSTGGNLNASTAGVVDVYYIYEQVK